MKKFIVRLETVVEANSDQAALTHVFLRLAPDLFVNTDVEELRQSERSLEPRTSQNVFRKGDR